MENEIKCPYCKEPQQYLMETRLEETGIYRCRKCKKIFEWFAETVIKYMTQKVTQL